MILVDICQSMSPQVHTDFHLCVWWRDARDPGVHLLLLLGRCVIWPVRSLSGKFCRGIWNLPHPAHANQKRIRSCFDAWNSFGLSLVMTQNLNSTIGTLGFQHKKHHIFLESIDT